MCQIKIQTTVKKVYILEYLSFTWECQPPCINWTDQGPWPLNMTADCEGFPYWHTDLLEWGWREYLFELIYSNEIFISSNENYHYFLQSNEVKNSCYFSYLCNSMRTVFCTVVFCWVKLLNPWKLRFFFTMESCYLNICCAFFCHQKGDMINRILY